MMKEKMKSALLTIGKDENPRLKLDIYPYVYARVSAMKGKLIPKQEYQRLLKLEPQSFLRYLEDTDYKNQLNELSGNLQGVKLIEHAVWKSIADSFDKLIRISSDEPLIIIKEYSKRWDYHNLLTIIRAKTSEDENKQEQSEQGKPSSEPEPGNSLRSLILPIGFYDPEHFMKLSKLPDVRTICMSSGLDILDTKKLSALAEAKDFAALEMLLMKSYYTGILKLAKAMPEGNPFAEFLLTEIDIINLKNLLRMLKANMPKEIIDQSMIIEGKSLNRRLLKALSASGSPEGAAKRLSSSATPYAKLVTDPAESLIETELNLERYLLSTSLLKSHQEPLTVISILSYMIAKEIEARNIRTMTRAKQAGIAPEYIETKMMVML